MQILFLIQDTFCGSMGQDLRQTFCYSPHNTIPSVVVGLHLAVFQRDPSVGIAFPAVSLRERQFTGKASATMEVRQRQKGLGLTVGLEPGGLLSTAACLSIHGENEVGCPGREPCFSPGSVNFSRIPDLGSLEGILIQQQKETENQLSFSQCIPKEEQWTDSALPHLTLAEKREVGSAMPGSL